MGKIMNFSHTAVWITADHLRYPLPARTTTTDIGVEDADGLLLDGRSVFFDSFRTDLGGGKTHTKGAIKFCSLGTMYLWDSIKPLDLKVTLDELAFVYNILEDGASPAGYKSEQWCMSHDGWNLAKVPLAPTAKAAMRAVIQGSRFAAGW